MSRVITRYVPHTITHVPDGGVTFEVFCVASGCAAESGPQDEQHGPTLGTAPHRPRRAQPFPASRDRPREAIPYPVRTSAR